MNLAIDIDGVLADFNEAYAQYFPEVKDKINFNDPTFPSVWDWPQSLGVSEEKVAEVWDKQIVPSETFWMKLNPMDEALEMLPKLCMLNEYHRVYFVTKRVGVNVQWQTAWWLETWGFRRPAVLIIDRKFDKAPVVKGLNIDMIIDDKPANLANHSPKVRTYLKDAPYNKTACPRCFDDRVGGIKEMLRKEGILA